LLHDACRVGLLDRAEALSHRDATKHLVNGEGELPNDRVVTDDEHWIDRVVGIRPDLVEPDHRQAKLHGRAKLEVLSALRALLVAVLQQTPVDLSIWVRAVGGRDDCQRCRVTPWVPDAASARVDQAFHGAIG